VIRGNYNIGEGKEWNGFRSWSTPISGYGEIRGVERIQGMEGDRLSNREVMGRDVLMEG